MSSAPLAAAGERAGGPAPRSLAESRVRSAWLFLCPMIVLMVLVAGWPLCRTLWFSVTDADLKDLGAAQFVGLDNYIGEFGVLRDPDWWRAVANTLWFAGISVAIETVLGIVVALVLNASFPGRSAGAGRGPGALGHPDHGVGQDVGLDAERPVRRHQPHADLRSTSSSQPLAWTADPSLALGSVIAVDVWKTTPFMALLILAALQMLPTDCYEAARVDGISSRQGVLPGDAAADPPGPDGGGDLPRARRAAHLRPHLRAHLEQQGHDEHVGLRPPAARRLPTGRARLRRLDGAVPASVALCTALYITLGRVRLEGAAG